MPEEGRIRGVHPVYKALQALGERTFVKRLHVFKIDGAMNDVLPLVDSPDSAGAAGEDAEAAE